MPLRLLLLMVLGVYAALAIGGEVNAQTCSGAPPSDADAVSNGGASHSRFAMTGAQIVALDRSGPGVAAAMPTKPPLDCADVLERVPRSKRTFLHRNCDAYIVLPNGDAINAFRALRIRSIENDMEAATGRTRSRLERSFYELAPGGHHLLLHEDGYASFRDAPIDHAGDDDIVYEYVNLPPMHELPPRPQPATRAAVPVLGASIGDHRYERTGNDFHIDLRTEHWLVGHVVTAGECSSRRIAVLAQGAPVIGARLERSVVLWPIDPVDPADDNQTGPEGLPMRYVALSADDFRASPAELACAAERGRVTLKTYAARSDRFREKRTIRVPSGMAGFVNKQVEYGPGLHRVNWRSNDVAFRITDPATHAEHIARQIEREDRQHGDNTTGTPSVAADAVTHTIELRDGRTLRGRLLSRPHADTVEFVVVVGSIEQTMQFPRSQVRGVTPAE